MTKTQILARLRGTGPDAAAVRTWATRHGKRIGTDPESVLRRIANALRDAEPHARDIAPAKDRQRHAAQIAGLARKLARAIETSPESFPPVVGLFDDGPAADIAQAAQLPEPMPAHGITTPQILADRFGFNGQKFPGLLRNLAQHAGQLPAPRDARPATGVPAARIAACALRRGFPRIPVPVIVAVIGIVWPDACTGDDNVKAALARKK